MLKPLTLALIAAPAMALASGDKPATWTCQNTVSEVSCSGGECDVATGGDFTPMHITASSDATMAFCAYSGCWEGQADAMTVTGSHLGWSGGDLRWSHIKNGPGVPASLTINAETRLGVVLVGGFAQPVMCSDS